jgi:hypothetical protein
MVLPSTKQPPGVAFVILKSAGLSVLPSWFNSLAAENPLSSATAHWALLAGTIALLKTTKKRAARIRVMEQCMDWWDIASWLLHTSFEACNDRQISLNLRRLWIESTGRMHQANLCQFSPLTSLHFTGSGAMERGTQFTTTEVVVRRYHNGRSN